MYQFLHISRWDLSLCLWLRAQTRAVVGLTDCLQCLQQEAVCPWQRLLSNGRITQRKWMYGKAGSQWTEKKFPFGEAAAELKMQVWSLVLYNCTSCFLLRRHFTQKEICSENKYLRPGYRLWILVFLFGAFSRCTQLEWCAFLLVVSHESANL